MLASSRVAGAGAVLCARALVVPSARAQGVGFGIAGAVTMHEINTSGGEHLNVAFTDKIVPVGGLVRIFDVGAGISIQPEALFSVKGSRLRLDGSREDIRLSYVEVPVLFRYSPSEGSPHDGSTSSQDRMLRFSSVRRRPAARLGRRGTSGTP